MAKKLSLREQLAAKRARTTTVPVQVSDPGPARSRVAELERVLTMRQVTNRAPKEILAAEQDLEEARQALKAFYVAVEFKNLEPVELEALQDAHTNADGELVRVTLAPALAAACAVDEDLQDEAWWVEQLGSGAWAWGEIDVLYTELLELNFKAPSSALPKG